MNLNLNKFDPIKGIETIGLRQKLLVGKNVLNKFDPIKGIETLTGSSAFISNSFLNKFDPIKGIETKTPPLGVGFL